MQVDSMFTINIYFFPLLTLFLNEQEKKLYGYKHVPNSVPLGSGFEVLPR